MLISSNILPPVDLPHTECKVTTVERTDPNFMWWKDYMVII